MIAGAVTGVLHTIFDIPAILAGILTQIGLWSVNLRVMGKSNTPLLKVDTIFSRIVDMSGMKQSAVSLVIGVLIAILIIAFLYWFFGTELGSTLRATGNNENMIRALGVNTKYTKLLALTLSNGFPVHLSARARNMQISVWEQEPLLSVWQLSLSARC